MKIKEIVSFNKSKIYIIQNFYRRKRKKKKKSSVTEFVLAKPAHCSLLFGYLKQLWPSIKNIFFPLHFVTTQNTSLKNIIFLLSK